MTGLMEEMRKSIREGIREDKVYYSSQELAELLGMSLRWVVKWRPWIVGARQFGREWRFLRGKIDRRIAAGKSILAYDYGSQLTETNQEEGNNHG
jgi:phage terminase Nu1 subunit (DNA packaging protein)